MGLHIKGMKIPKERRITIQIGTDGAVYTVTSCKITAEVYEKKCLAIEIPEPHGRLIDADALEYEEVYLNGHYELGDVEIVTRKDIELAPTIIPASEEVE